MGIRKTVHKWLSAFDRLVARRQSRKSGTCSPQNGTGPNQSEPTTCQIPASEQHMPGVHAPCNTPTSTTETTTTTTTPTVAPAKQPPPPKDPPKGWMFRPDAEFPWRLEQIVQEEDNWRGTWVLQVKDLRAMDWGTERVAKADGRGCRYVTRPTRQLPFGAGEGSCLKSSLDGGQDDLMVQLGRE